METSDRSSEVKRRYAEWQKSSPIMLLALGAVVVCSLYFHIPGVVFVAANAIAGLSIFICWRATVRRSERGALAAAVVAGALACLAVVSELSLPLPLLFAQGIGVLGFAMSLAFYVSRYEHRG